MRCLYCGKELALLKRLRGGGDFCSEAHKQSYQEEYNRLALSRLLQAQKKGKPGSAPAAQVPSEPPPPHVAEPPQAVVAVEEPTHLEPELEETEVDAPVLASLAEVAEVETTTPEPADETAPDNESSFNSEPASGEPEPVESAGFMFESLSVVQGPDASPYLETWVDAEPSAEPAVAGWQIQTRSFVLGSTDLLPFDFELPESKPEEQAVSANVSPEPFGMIDAELAPLRSSEDIAPKNRFTAASAVAIDTPPSSSLAAPETVAKPVEFHTPVAIDEPELLALSHTPIEFPAEDVDVVLVQPLDRGSTMPAAEEPPAGSFAPDSLGDSPKEALRALSRLHQELAEQESARTEEPASIAVQVEARQPVTVKVVRAVAVDVVAKPVALPEPPKMVEIAAEPVPAAQPVLATEPVVEEVEEPAPEPEAQQPGLATELFEIAIKPSPPIKGAIMAGGTCPPQIAPLLPNLKSLPLRPKMALATGYVPPAKAAAPAQSTKPVAARTEAPKAAPAKPAQAGAKAQPEAKAQAPEAKATAQTAAAKTEAKPAAKPVAAPHQAVKAQAVAKGPAANQPAAKAEQAKPVAEAAKPKAETKTEQPQTGQQKTEQAKTEQPKTSQPKTDQAKPKAESAKPAFNPPKEDDVPNFGGVQPAPPSWLGSLKLKLGLAIVLLAVACTYFVGWGGGKPHTQGSAGVSSDGSGPSIIMGEGGWVEDWGGDPTGIHAGRQITIYRPSLKLSDYRLEFQGTIDLKSVGWVFRAADPQNYYAMKLMIIQSGLSSKVALFKFLVVNGKQTQVGRVPIDIAVQADTVFNVRLDVRGPQFTTFIQGQQVDNWTDDQLKIGGTGFLNEREERGKVKSVSIRYLSGGAK